MSDDKLLYTYHCDPMMLLFFFYFLKEPHYHPQFLPFLHLPGYVVPPGLWCRDLEFVSLVDSVSLLTQTPSPSHSPGISSGLTAWAVFLLFFYFATDECWTIVGAIDWNCGRCQM